MPELPEVESVARTLRDGRPSLLGARVTAVDPVWPGVAVREAGCRDLAELSGCRCISVGRLGKYLLVGLEDPQGRVGSLVIHLRMTGRLDLVPSGEPIGRHTRLSLTLDNGHALRFDDPRKFGRVWLTGDAATVTAGLGPDALDIALETFTARLAGHRRQIKPLLLDQSVVAGIGNIYADESLHRAGIHPAANSADLTPAEISRLHGAVVAVLGEAVAAQGANIDGVFKAGRFIVSVYGRQGRPCPVCGTPVSKTRLGQRGTHFCPGCQPPPAPVVRA